MRFTVSTLITHLIKPKRPATETGKLQAGDADSVSAAAGDYCVLMKYQRWEEHSEEEEKGNHKSVISRGYQLTTLTPQRNTDPRSASSH